MMMDPKLPSPPDEHPLQRILGDALECDSGEQARFLDEACAGDPEHAD